MEILFKIKTKQTANKQLLSLPNKPTNKNNQPNVQQPENSVGFLMMQACLSEENYTISNYTINYTLLSEENYTISNFTSVSKDVS